MKTFDATKKALLVKEIHMTKTIDTTKPWEMEGFIVEEHISHERIEWPQKTELYLSEKQKNGYISGDGLRQELKGKQVLNSAVAKYLYKNPELIPEDWKEKSVCFWGTIYRGESGRLFVRYLCFGGGHWCWGCRYLGRGFSSSYPALVRVSSESSELSNSSPCKLCPLFCTYCGRKL